MLIWEWVFGWIPSGFDISRRPTTYLTKTKYVEQISKSKFEGQITKTRFENPLSETKYGN